MKLTIFTPTYNREKLLVRVYESLMSQTCHDFIWLVVDDGSTDNTIKLLEELQGKNKELGEFEIRYHYRSNGGKMRAHNTGAKLCTTELFLCLDSDDILVDTAVKDILDKWESESDKDALTGIVAYKGEKTDDGAFRRFRDASFMPITLDKGRETLRNIYRQGFFGETTLVFRTSELIKYPFPEIEGEKYVPEDYIYDKIDSDGQLLIMPKVITVCELMDGGYTDLVQKLREDNPTGWLLYYEQRAMLEPWSVLKIKYISHYLRFCKILKWKIKVPFGYVLIGLPGYIGLALFGKT